MGCYNKEISIPENIQKLAQEKRSYIENAIMICDDSGCTIISEEQINHELFRKLEFIELQEDIWYYCIDTLKWSTYKTICKKDYLQEREILPEILRQRMSEFNL